MFINSETSVTANPGAWGCGVSASRSLALLTAADARWCGLAPSCPGALGQGSVPARSSGADIAAAAAAAGRISATWTAHRDSPPSGAGGSRAPGARHRVGASGAGNRCEHGGELAAQCGQPGHLGVDLGQAAAQQVSGRLARALTGIAEVQQLADGVQAQAEPLCAADELQPVQRALVVPAVVAGGARRRGQQAFPLVVA